MKDVITCVGVAIQQQTRQAKLASILQYNEFHMILYAPRRQYVYELGGKISG